MAIQYTLSMCRIKAEQQMKNYASQAEYHFARRDD